MATIHDKIQELPTSSRDLAGLFIGEVIANGMSRTVYQHAQDPSLVIKVELQGDHFQNVMEWRIWNDIKDTALSKWFVPCVDISANGIFLIQKKVDLIPLDQFPKQIPYFFTDLKYQNYGIYNKHFVCLDYGTINIFRLTNFSSKRMQKPKWWKE